jgi:hypothetical protein
MVNECIPTREAAYTQKITVHADAALTGKTFCGPLTSQQSGGLGGLASDPLAANDGGNMRTAGPPSAGGKVGGVVGWDVPTAGKGPVIRGAGTFLPVTSGAAVAVGDELKVDASGRVLPITTGAYYVGKAHSVAGAAGVDVLVELGPIPSTVIGP